MAVRIDDLRDIRDRLLRILAGRERPDFTALPEGTVLLATRLTPSETAQLDPESIAGSATVTGGRTSHVSIFARSLGIPAIVAAGDGLLSIDEGTEVACRRALAMKRVPRGLGCGAGRSAGELAVDVVHHWRVLVLRAEQYELSI